jgi:outer membrane lipoprotein-sorting protein
MIKKIFFVAFWCFTLALEANAGGYEESYAKLSESSRVKVDLANKYFDSVNTFKSNFLQFNAADSSISEGIIYIKKPDKIKVEYTNPFRTVFVKNKEIINYYDVDLDELMVLPQSISPIFDLLSKQPNLKTSNSVVLSLENDQEGNVLLNTEIPIKENKIRVLYVFDGEIKNLIGLGIDAGEIVELSFFNTSINQDIDKKTFIFDNPRLFKNKRIRNK